MPCAAARFSICSEAALKHRRGDLIARSPANSAIFLSFLSGMPKIKTDCRCGVNSNFRATLLAVSKPSKPVRHLSAPVLGRVREAVSLSVLFTPDVFRSECAEASWALTIPLQGRPLVFRGLSWRSPPPTSISLSI